MPRRASVTSGRVALRVGESRYFDDANGIASLVRNSIDAHIELSLIWLAVSETRHLFLIFDLDAVRPIRARMSLVPNARRHWPRMGCGRPGATASTMDEESIECVSRLA